MSDVLKKEIQDRANAVGWNTRQTRRQNILRVTSLLVMAIFVYHYHAMLFGAIQPWIDKLYQLIK